MGCLQLEAHDKLTQLLEAQRPIELLVWFPRGKSEGKIKNHSLKDEVLEGMTIVIQLLHIA